MLRRSLTGSLLLLALVPTSAAHSLTVKGDFLGRKVEIRIAGLTATDGEAAMQAAETELAEDAALVDSRGEVVSGLNQSAGQGPQPIDPRLVRLLQRSQGFCVWSEGSYGALGGWLYAVWGLRQAVSRLPGDQGLPHAIELARCNNMSVDAKRNTVQLATHARLDFWGIASGFAVDQLVEKLKSLGIANAMVRIGGVERAFGAGPQGKGWPVTVPLPKQLEGLADELPLRDRAIAIVSAQDGALHMGGTTYPPYLDQRTGRPPDGVIAVAAVTELAVDAQGVAVTGFVAGSRRGRQLAAVLVPPPSMLWALGDGHGSGLITDYRWSRIRVPEVGDR